MATQNTEIRDIARISVLRLLRGPSMKDIGRYGQKFAQLARFFSTFLGWFCQRSHAILYALGQPHALGIVPGNHVLFRAQIAHCTWAGHSASLNLAYDVRDSGLPRRNSVRL